MDYTAGALEAARLEHDTPMKTQAPVIPQSPRSRYAALAVVALLALIAYLFMNRIMLGDVIAQFPSRGIYKTAFYLAWIAAGFGVFAGLVLFAGARLLGVLLPLFCFSVVMNEVFSVVSRQQLTPDLTEWMAHETGQLPMAGREFLPEIALALVQTIAVLALFLMIRVAVSRYGLLPSKALAGRGARRAALAAFFGFHGAALLLQPSYTVAETNVFVFGLPALVTTAPQHETVAVQASATAPAEKIVFVVDESVGHHVFRRMIAPKLAGLPAVDYGEAAATATCSAPSNALLRWGLEQSGIGQTRYDPRTNPTIWGYAKAAGFRTTLIEGQSKGATQNFVGKGELSLIDEFLPADVGVDTDQRIAGLMLERINRPGKQFVFVVKRGAHFPYEMNYPSGVLPVDSSKVAKYDAAVSHATGRFFPLLVGAPFANTLIVYTSDHGQNLASRAVHCSDEHHADEYAVPLVVITQAKGVAALLSPGAAGMRDRASHLNIFPTLLYAMGYSREWVEMEYGPTLAGPPGPYLTLGWHLPYPTRRNPLVEFWRTDHFPGRGTRSVQ